MSDCRHPWHALVRKSSLGWDIEITYPGSWLTSWYWAWTQAGAKRKARRLIRQYEERDRRRQEVYYIDGKGNRLRPSSVQSEEV